MVIIVSSLNIICIETNRQGLDQKNRLSIISWLPFQCLHLFLFLRQSLWLMPSYLYFQHSPRFWRMDIPCKLFLAGKPAGYPANRISGATLINNCDVISSLNTTIPLRNIFLWVLHYARQPWIKPGYHVISNLCIIWGWLTIGLHRILNWPDIRPIFFCRISGIRPDIWLNSYRASQKKQPVDIFSITFTVVEILL